MIDSYGGNLIYHGGNFVGGVEKKDYIEPNVVLKIDYRLDLDRPESARSPVFSCTEVPTGTSAIGTSATYSTAWHSWGAPTVNDCYVYSAAWSGNIEQTYGINKILWKNTLTAKQDINKVWKGTDRPVPTYVVKRWDENGYHYGFCPVNALESLGIVSICYDRSHSASEIKPSGYQLDCSHIKNYAVLKADLGPSSYACFNVLGKSTSGPNSGCYWIENLTALDCSALVGGTVTGNEKGLFPYVIKNALFSLASGVNYSYQALGCKYAINVSGASDDVKRNRIFAENFSGCHNVMYDSLYVTTSTGNAYINLGWWKNSNLYTHEDWEFREIHNYDWDLCDTDGTKISGGIIDSDITFSDSLRDYYLPTVLSSTIDGTNALNWKADHSEFKDSTFSGRLINGNRWTSSGSLWITTFSSCKFKNVNWLHNQGYEAGNGVMFNLPSAYTDNSGVLRGIWTSARL